MGPAEDTFEAYVLDRLAPLQGLGCRAMFGGHGLYLGPTFFGILFAGRLYFKTNDATVDDYLRYGMRPFQPGDEKVLRTYYEVPPAVIEDQEQLLSWARVAAETAAAVRERAWR